MTWEAFWDLMAFALQTFALFWLPFLLKSRVNAGIGFDGWFGIVICTYVLLKGATGGYQ